MSIRAKLAWTFILLLIFGITAISSYSILFIRNYLLEEGVKQIRADSELLAITIRNLPENELYTNNLNEIAEASGYRISIYDEDGFEIAAAPVNFTSRVETLSSGIRNRISGGGQIITGESEDPDLLLAYSRLNRKAGTNRYLQVSQLQDQIYAPIKTIRWIIYTGMFISIGLVILVSIWFANYMSRPILQLKSAAKRIAEGDVGETLQLNRSDEFGALAKSLNRMALRLRSDNEKLMMLYNRQGQFFADITHELRNPLHTIAGALEMLQMDKLPQAQKKHYLNTAMRQTDRINRLFKDLVVLQRYDSDAYFLEEKDFDLSGTLTRVYELYYPEAKSKGIELEFDTVSRVVRADPGKIEQVLENLVSNAIKYTNEGVIEIRCHDKNDKVVVEVLDTGIGIAEEHIEHLFDRFYRTDKARSRDSGGTGLGLSVVKSILDAHNSEIRITSEPGKGTSITFDLPHV